MRPRAAGWGFLAAALTALVATAADGPLPDLPEYVFAVPPEDENLDVLHFGEAGPTLIRFRVRIDGRGYRTAWDEALGRLYRFADVDGDGILNEAEAARPGWGRLIASPYGGLGSGPNPAQGDGKARLEPKGGKVTLEDFTRYVRDGLGHGPLLIQATLAANPVDQAAFNQIDADRDGVLTTAELASAEGLIRRLDVDEDEVVDQAELDPSRSPFAGLFFGEGGAVAGDPLGGPFVALATGEARARAARRLLDRYDGGDSADRDGWLSPAEAGLGLEAFRLADASGDGRLDLDELERFLAGPSPTIVLVVRVSKGPGRGAEIRLPTPGEGAKAADPRFKSKPERGLTLDLEGREVRLAANDTVQDYKPVFERRFQAADLDRDGVLDRSESRKDPLLANIFEAADRDGDGRLPRAELAAYLERSLDLGRSRASIGFTDAGRAFLEVIDGDNDGRIGRRELREASKHLKPFDRDGDGRVRFDEIPLTSRIAVGRGPSFPDRRGQGVDGYDSPDPPRPGAIRPGLAWFRRMDRNRDGDVSPGEFLGTPEDFRKLDRDGDALISEEEASRGP